MNKIAYTVICAITDKQKAAAWLKWLQDGHIQDVIAGGATQATIVQIDNTDNKDDTKTTYEVRYTFSDRATYDAYICDHAPRLRDDGLKRFPPESGFSYNRTVGEIIG